MDITIFLLHLAHGGVEKASSELANAFVKRGHNVKLCVTYQLGEPAYPLDNRIEIEYLSDRKPNREAFHDALKHRHLLRLIKEGLSAARTLWVKSSTFKKKLRSIRAGIVICTRHEQNLELAKIKQPKLFKVAQLHHDIFPQSNQYFEVARRYDNIDVVTALTEELIAELDSAFKKEHADSVRKPQFVWMPNFIENALLESNVFHQAKQAADKNTISETETRTILAVGRLEHEKGFDRLLEIWVGFGKDYPNWTLELIGDGSQKTVIEGIIQQHSMENQVRLPGMLPFDKVLAAMANSDFFVMPSRSEGFGLVLVEAAAMRLPLIAFDVRSGPRSIIEEGLNGFLIEDGNLEAFATACKLLMNEPERRLRMGQTAYEMAGRFSETEVMKRWEAVLEMNEKF